jgi:hypothetical protein
MNHCQSYVDAYMPLKGRQCYSPLVDMLLSVKIGRDVAALPDGHTIGFGSIHVVKQHQGGCDDTAFQ